MTDPITEIVEAARSLPIEERGYVIARRSIAAVRAADAAIADQALEAEFRAWWHQSWGTPPNAQAVATAMAWGRHLLTQRGRVAP